MLKDDQSRFLSRRTMLRSLAAGCATVAGVRVARAGEDDRLLDAHAAAVDRRRHDVQLLMVPVDRQKTRQVVISSMFCRLRLSRLFSSIAC